jgi:hypothetical protein
VGPVFSLGATMRCRENSQKCGGAASSEDSTAHSPALAQGQKQEQPKILILRFYVR